MSKPLKCVKLPLTWNIDILKSVDPDRLCDRFSSLCDERLGYDFGLDKSEVTVVKQCVVYLIDKLRNGSTFARELEFKTTCRGNGRLYSGLAWARFIVRKANRFYTLRAEGVYKLNQN